MLARRLGHAVIDQFRDFTFTNAVRFRDVVQSGIFQGYSGRKRGRKGACSLILIRRFTQAKWLSRAGHAAAFESLDS